jgi:uncharacterized Zn finger protein
MMNRPNLILCESCGGKLFTAVFFLAKISKIAAGTSEDVIKPLQTFKCDNCGHINKEFDMPEEEKDSPKIIP